MSFQASTASVVSVDIRSVTASTEAERALADRKRSYHPTPNRVHTSMSHTRTSNDYGAAAVMN
jgi:hypothetical protein